MELSFAGIMFGFVAAMVVVGIIVGMNSKKADASKARKTFTKIICVVVIVCFCLLGGYLGRTELILGDYSHEICDWMGCNKPAICEFHYNFDTNFYCEDDIDYCYRLTGDIKSTPVDEDDFGHDKYDVWTAAVDIVESQLKSPSTAEFCKTSEATITKSGNTWTIKGYVDAQNSFGATLRNNFTVKITFTSSTKYTIEQCSITAK